MCSNTHTHLPPESHPHFPIKTIHSAALSTAVGTGRVGGHGKALPTGHWVMEVGLVRVPRSPQEGRYLGQHGGACARSLLALSELLQRATSSTAHAGVPEPARRLCGGCEEAWGLQGKEWGSLPRALGDLPSKHLQDATGKMTGPHCAKHGPHPSWPSKPPRHETPWEWGVPDRSFCPAPAPCLFLILLKPWPLTPASSSPLRPTPLPTQTLRPQWGGRQQRAVSGCEAGSSLR